MNGAAIRADRLSVRYGRREALRAVSLEVAPGATYALLGRSGSGKSSLVRALLGQVRASAGRAEVLGLDAWRERARLMDRVGFMAEEADAPPEMRVREIAQFSSRIYSRWNGAAFEERLRRFAIRRDARIDELSKGERKQVALAAALAISPEILVLDDPTLGLDVVARRSLFEEVIGEMAERGITVFIATHDLAAVETVADRAAILHEGAIVLDEDLETLKGRFRRVRFATRPVSLEAVSASAVRQWGGGAEAVVSNFDEAVLERLRASGETTVAEIAPMSLEEIFVAVAGESAGGAR